MKAIRQSIAYGLAVTVSVLIIVVGLVWDDRRTASMTEVTAVSPAMVRPTPSVVTLIGDSYTGGSAMSNYSRNWQFVVGSEMYARGKPLQFTISGEGGSGYVARGLDGTIFPEEAQAHTHPDSEVVIVFGGRNDMGLYVGDAASETYSAIRTIAPKAELIVIGPTWVNDAVPQELELVRDQIRAAAAEAQATFVDPLAERWFFGPDSSLIASDGVHPTDAGHAYLASKIGPILEGSLRATVAEN